VRAVPNNANAFAVNTRNGSAVTPNVAGIESNAKSKSVEAIAIITRNIGVANFFPSTVMKSFDLVIFIDHRDRFAHFAKEEVFTGIRVLVPVAKEANAGPRSGSRRK
jgi:hypothetical protein